jgi:circadian clock protein KaiC
MRVAFDSLSEMRLLAQNPLHYRRQILALKQFFRGRQCTVLLLDDRTSEPGDLQLQSLAHGVVSLGHSPQDYGSSQRRLRIVKMRGQDFSSGYHDFRIRTGGLEVYPRLVALEHPGELQSETAFSGIDGLDRLTGGGIHCGTSTLIMGPAGSGKSSLAIQYAVTAAKAGRKAVICTFDESLATMRRRSKGLGIDLESQLESGKVGIRHVDPAELSIGEFTHLIRREVEQNDVGLLVIDSLNGFLASMPEQRFLTLHLHELLSYLGQKGVATFLILAQYGMLGQDMQNPIDASYIADNVILLRFFEAGARVRRAISVVKHRGGWHEDTLRELTMSERGIAIGEPLFDLHGVLTGVPQFVGRADPTTR